MIHQILDDGRSIGTIRRITSQFSFMAPEEFLKGNIRVSHELEPLGALGDLGWYNIRFALWVMKYQMPHSVSGRLLAQHARQDSHKPVPFGVLRRAFFPRRRERFVLLFFSDRKPQWANVSGTKGYLHVPDFVVPFFGCETAFDVQNAELHVYGCDFNMESHLRRPAVHEYGNGAPMPRKRT